MATQSKRYAARTAVSEEKSRAEIDALLRKHGATEFLCGHSGDTAMIAFRIRDCLVRMTLPLPPEEDRRFRYDGRGMMRSSAARRKAWEQERRQRWRALLLALKAKFAAIEAGITTLENEFFSALVLPNKQTMIEWASPQLARIQEGGELPALLPGLPPGRD